MCAVSSVILSVVTVMSVAAASVMFFLLVKERKRRACSFPRVSIKEQVDGRAEALKAFYELVYYSCDNFSKYSGKLSGCFSQWYEDGTFRNFTADIVPAVNVAEGGALAKMAVEYSLTDLELKTCCYVYLGFTWQQACTAEGITENAYNVRCSRIRKKFGLVKDETILEFVAGYCQRHTSLSAQ